MEGVIQIRAGRAVCVNAEGAVFAVGGDGRCFLAGDRVVLRGGRGAELVERTPTWTVGFVRSVGGPGGVAVVEAPLFAPFRASVVPVAGLKAGDRTLLYLDATGGAQIFGSYSSDGRSDVELLRLLYAQAGAAGVTDGIVRVGEALYTEAARVDHRDLETVTVDPVGSVDLDDAISVDASAGVLYVHIVDIHRAVAAGSALDEHMCRYGSTLYLANEHTEHLLPAATLRGCSLDVGVPREAVTVRMTMDGSGAIVDYGIYPSVILVKKRLGYADIGPGTEGWEDEENLGMRWLWERARAASSVTLAIPGLDLEVGRDGGLRGMRAVATNDAAHRMVSFAMIAANFTVSAHLRRRGVVLPNRFHEAVRGLTAGDVEAVTGDATVDSYLAVKAWRPARYDVEQSGHFGLGLQEYCHFTSPMRRYADVFVHRILAGVVYDEEWLVAAVDRLNARMALVKQIHRYYRDVKVARRLGGGGVGLEAVVTKVARSGVSWFVPTVLVGGYTHVSRVGGGRRWTFAEEGEGGSRLRSPDGVVIRVGSRLRVEGLEYDYGSGAYAATGLSV
jgi:exoribonuclease R